MVELHAPIVTLGFIKRTWEKEVACHAFKESFKATWEKIPAKIALQTTSPIRPNKRCANAATMGKFQLQAAHRVACAQQAKQERCRASIVP